MQSQQYFTAFDSLIDPIWVCDHNEIVWYINKSAEIFFQSNCQKAIGESISAIWKDYNKLPSREIILDEVKKNGHFASADFPNSKINGIGWYGTVITILSADDEELLVYHAHDRIRSCLNEANPDSTRQLLNSVATASILPVIVTDTDGVIIHFNSAAEKLCGVASSASVGVYLGDKIKERTGKSFDLKSLLRMAQINGQAEGEIAIPEENNGCAKNLSLTLLPLVDLHNQLSGFLALCRDISEKVSREDENQRLSQQIQRAQKLESLGVLAGGIAHDFNNILLGILGNVNLVLMDLPPESPARSSLREVERSAQRAAELVKQMLAYSGKGRFIVEELNLTRVIEEMSHLLEASIGRSAVLRYHFSAAVPPVEADASQIRQVVMNLIVNASEAVGDKSGVVSISTGAMEVDSNYLDETFINESLPPGIYSYIEVSDTGVGMDEATRQKIFDPFFSTKFPGRGLGLAAVLGIVRGHKGAIKIYSEPGRGSTFKVLLPAHAEQIENQNRPGEKDATPVQYSSQTVLVVDDMDTVRAVARLALERFGFRVITATDGREAMEIYQQENGNIDLVLLDMTMPRMNGQETYREMRRINPSVRVLLSSGYNEREATESFAGKGLAGFIQKPYKPLDLVHAVQSILNADIEEKIDPNKP
jgi:PAS domain S-box-containing protein